jgi:hypothetical protein
VKPVAEASGVVVVAGCESAAMGSRGFSGDVAVVTGCQSSAMGGGQRLKGSNGQYENGGS